MLYFDNAATMQPHYKALEVYKRTAEEVFGNPSSLHTLGVKAEQVINESRKVLAKELSCDPDNIIFTSGATESNNLGLFSSASAYGRNGSRIVTTSVEHPSVAEPLKYLSTKGFEVVYIKPDRNGEINPQEFLEAVNDNTCLVSCMLVNNETGYILPVRRIFTAIKHKNSRVVTHCDAVQGFMKIPVKMTDLQADLITVSAHKIGGVKGVGALIKSKNVRIIPQIYGGGQERNSRSGTENVPAIASFASAVEYTKKGEELISFLRNNLNREYITINSPENGSPYILNVSVEGVKSEVMLHFLESKEIYVSSGSACSKGKVSGVLREFGVKNPDFSIRISLSDESTKNDLRTLIKAIDEGYNSLLHMR
ncbi:MAG: cysteine desulfurase [Oscillospiraceae bacterium]|jgi:cysteine desulfurase|nr:cysteine desulfurase [Oscillospiraceae bacterium]